MPVVVAAVRMGYGHLRAGLAVAQAAGVPLSRADDAPLAGPIEAAVWEGARVGYEALSRRAASHGGLAARVLDDVTAIPEGDGGEGRAAARAVGWCVSAGLGATLARTLAAGDGRLVSTYFTAAHAADRAGLPAWLVVTDVDCARAWVPPDPAAGRLVYCAPTPIVAARLRGYGVPDRRVVLTGFPLPPALADGAADHLAARLRRLRDGAPLRILLAVGGAGAQVDQVAEILATARPGEVEITVSAGTRPEVAARVAAAGARVVCGETFEAYAAAFDAAVAEADVLWTKPSELVFFAALGLPVAPAPPVGVQEARNFAWLRAHDLALPEHAPAELIGALLTGRAHLADVAERAWATLPRDGAARIAGLAGG